MLTRLMVVLICAPVMVAAQAQITPDDFLDRANGRTLTFEHFPDGGIVGVEEFLSRSRTVWATPDGVCTYGRIEVRETLLCFIYEDLPVQEHCWLPFDHDGGMVVMSGIDSVQQVTRITRRPVVCEDEAIS